MEHDQLERNRVSDVGRKGHGGVLAYDIGDVDEHRHDRVRAQVDPESAADSDPSVSAPSKATIGQTASASTMKNSG